MKSEMTPKPVVQLGIRKSHLLRICQALEERNPEKCLCSVEYKNLLLSYEVARRSNSLFPCHISIDHTSTLLVFLNPRTGYIIMQTDSKEKSVYFCYHNGELELGKPCVFSEDPVELVCKFKSPAESLPELYFEPPQINTSNNTQSSIFNFGKQKRLEEMILPTEETLLKLHQQLHDPKCLQEAKCLNIYKEEIALPIIGNMGHEYRFIRINRMAVLAEAFDPKTHLVPLVKDLKEVNTASYFICSAAPTFTIIVNDQIIQKNFSVFETNQSNTIATTTTKKTEQKSSSPMVKDETMQSASPPKLTPSQDSTIKQEEQVLVQQSQSQLQIEEPTKATPQPRVSTLKIHRQQQPEKNTASISKTTNPKQTEETITTVSKQTSTKKEVEHIKPILKKRKMTQEEENLIDDRTTKIRNSQQNISKKFIGAAAKSNATKSSTLPHAKDSSTEQHQPAKKQRT